MIDGTVDLTLDGNPYYAEAARTFEASLANTLDVCTDVRPCRRDVAGADALDGYDELAARLKGGPIAYWYVRPDGSRERRLFTLGDLETAAGGSMYEESDRMQFQRALAWATRGELLPLARLAHVMIGQDPDTLEAIPDPSWSDAMFYAVECMDYAYGSGSAANRVDQYLDAGEAADVADVRLGSIFYGDLPCAYWPVHGPSQRPDYLRDTPFPIFVLGSTWDPVTPYAGSLRIFDHRSDAYLITQPGGPHIIFGRGNACPDDLITAFLARGKRPAERQVTCGFTGVDEYVRNPASRVGRYANALAAMSRMDDEINYSVSYWYWDGVDPLRHGCLFGGFVRYTPFADGYRVRLRDCAFSRGLPLTGRATIDTTAGTFTLRVTSGHGTRLTYTHDADGHRSVRGRYLGKPVNP